KPRSVAPIALRASFISLKTCHLCTRASLATSFVAICAASIPSDIDRRPNGVVAKCVCIFPSPYVEAKEFCSPKRRTEPQGLLTAIRGFAILSVATRSEKASAAVTFRGPFLLPASAPLVQNFGTHRTKPASAAG